MAKSPLGLGASRGGGHVSGPRLSTAWPPEYTDEAREAGIEGEVLLAATIGADGLPRNLRVRKSLGYGLDEKAIECVSNFRFTPRVLEGKSAPEASTISISVFFRLDPDSRAVVA